MGKDFLEANIVGVNILFVSIYSNQDGNTKRYKTSRYYLPKGIIKNCNVAIIGKMFYNQPINSSVKWCEEINKLTTGQGGDYTTGCLLDYDYIKNITG